MRIGVSVGHSVSVWPQKNCLSISVLETRLTILLGRPASTERKKRTNKAPRSSALENGKVSLWPSTSGFRPRFSARERGSGGKWGGGGSQLVISV